MSRRKLDESEEEYDELNNETFGDDHDVTDWEVDHELWVSELVVNEGDDMEPNAAEGQDQEGADGKIVTVEEVEAKLQQDLVFKENSPPPTPNTEGGMNQRLSRPQSRTQSVPPHMRGRPFHNGRHHNHYQPRFMPTVHDRMGHHRFLHPSQRGMGMPPGPPLFYNQGPRNPNLFHNNRNYPMYRPFSPRAMDHYQNEQLVRMPLQNRQYNTRGLPGQRWVVKRSRG